MTTTNTCKLSRCSAEDCDGSCHNKTNKQALLPCPFCGGEAAFYHDDNGWNWIECQKCGACTKVRVSAMDDCKPLLMEQWNIRTAVLQKVLTRKQS